MCNVKIQNFISSLSQKETQFNYFSFPFPGLGND
jgi:hypothetical protein